MCECVANGTMRDDTGAGLCNRPGAKDVPAMLAVRAEATRLGRRDGDTCFMCHSNSNNRRRPSKNLVMIIFFLRVSHEAVTERAREVSPPLPLSFCLVHKSQAQEDMQRALPSGPVVPFPGPHFLVAIEGADSVFHSLALSVSGADGRSFREDTTVVRSQVAQFCQRHHLDDDCIAPLAMRLSQLLAVQSTLPPNSSGPTTSASLSSPADGSGPSKPHFCVRRHEFSSNRPVGRAVATVTAVAAASLSHPKVATSAAFASSTFSAFVPGPAAASALAAPVDDAPAAAISTPVPSLALSVSASSLRQVCILTFDGLRKIPGM